ncbi:hypothetical protein KNN17_03625 [Arthrobacter bambusae]|uniref:trypco2 family protein n=1 Tax=Arthrobacter bambusae TaxID=1338426 RepID=UPI001F509CC4|nr:trypco2 family protein [Arthrobacter bambusae]MCI0140662.1 hypothetical protein [Arthrobacter bambusae]
MDWFGGFMCADRIELSNMVASLRSEITKAWQEGQYDTVGFEAGEVEVELTTEIEIVQLHGKVSAKFWVLNAEMEAGRTRTDTQRIRFSFTPRDRRDPSKPLMIAGQAAAGERPPAISPPEDPPARQSAS